MKKYKSIFIFYKKIQNQKIQKIQKNLSNLKNAYSEKKIDFIFLSNSSQ